VTKAISDLYPINTQHIHELTFLLISAIFFINFLLIIKFF
jgi:hypothetical protein